MPHNTPTRLAISISINTSAVVRARALENISPTRIFLGCSALSFEAVESCRCGPPSVGYGHVARKCPAIPALADNRSNPAGKESNPLKFGKKLRQTKECLETGTAYVNLTLQNPSWGYQRLKSHHIYPN